MSDSKKIIPIIEIETQRRQLVEHLNNNPSAASRWFHFISFFEILLRQPDQHRFQSYFLELAPHGIRMVDPILLQNKNPQQLELHLQILMACRQWLYHSELLEKLKVAEKNLRLTTALTYLYVADTAAACRTLDWSIENITTHSELETALVLTESAMAKGLPLAHELAHEVHKWRDGIALFSAENLSVLLVDQDECALEVRGRILLLHLQARERPKDAEEDTIKINNTIPAGQASLSYSLTDAIRAANHLVFSRQDRDVHYSYHYSISDKEAEFSGNSIGLAAGLLAFAGRHNRHYRRPIIKLNNYAAVTGGLAPDGRVLSVDEQSLSAKIQATFFSPLQRVYVPADNLRVAHAKVEKLNNLYPQRNLNLMGVHSLQQAVNDQNLLQKHQPSPFIKTVAAVHRARHKTPIIAAAVLLLLVLLFSQVHSCQWWQDRIPARCEIQDRDFIALNAAGERLWQFYLGVELNPIDYNPKANRIVIQDMEQDGKKEILLGTFDPQHSENSGKLYCFSQEGILLWSKKLGKTLRFGKDTANNHYNITNIITEKIYPDSNSMIIVVCNHLPYFPAMVGLFNSRGVLRGEYWNAGNILAVTTFDTKINHSKKIVIGGYDNESDQAVIAVLDPDHMSGASPRQKEKFKSPDLGKGTQEYFIRFPKSPFVAGEKQRDAVICLDRYENLIKVHIANANLYTPGRQIEGSAMYGYFFNAQMKLCDMIFPDLFYIQYQKTTGSSLSDNEKTRLRKIEYWDGEKWTNTPTKQ